MTGIPRNLLIGAAALVILAAVPGVYFFTKYQGAQDALKNPQKAAQEETKALVAKVSQLIELPQGEEPTVATIQDKNKLKDQPFFAKAENGDKVLIYTKAQKAILYRPSINKVIEVAPINLGSTSPTTASATVKVALLNGTTTIGLTKTVETDIKGKVSNLDVVIKDNAVKSDYTKTIVVDLSGNNKTTADAIAKAMNGTVGNLPDGETKQATDILVIIGSDYIKK